MTVLVARETIPKGTSGNVLATKALYTATTIRESQLREGAISDPASLQGTVATREVFEGAQLTSADFVAGGRLARGDAHRPRARRLGAARRRARHGRADRGREPGRRLRRLQRDPARPAWTARQRRTGPADAAPDHVRRPVVAVGEKASTGSGSTNVSLKVDDEKAAQLAFASDNGKVWLALRPSAGAMESRPGLVTVETMLLGVPPVKVLQSVGGNR